MFEINIIIIIIIGTNYKISGYNVSVGLNQTVGTAKLYGLRSNMYT